MNEANIDHLLQVTAPRSNWGTANLANGRDDQPAFDDHLAQASTPRAPTEPVRPRDSRPSESSQPASGRTPDGEANRPGSDKTDDTAAPTATAENDARDGLRPAEATDADAAAAGPATADEVTENDSVAQQDGEIQSNEEPDQGDEDDDRQTESSVAADVAAAPPAIVLPSSLELKVSGSDAAAASSGKESESSEPNAKQVSPAHVRQPSDGSQPTKPVGDSETFMDVLQAQALPEQVDADQAAPTGPQAATAPVPISATLHAAEAAVAPTPQIAKVDRPATPPKRQRATSSEAPPTSDPKTKANGQEPSNTVTPSRVEGPASKAEQSTDEPREDSSIRPAAGRRASRPDVPSGNDSNGRIAMAAAANDAPAEAATETTKTDATDEAVRPTPPHAPRSDALLHPLVKLQRGGAAVVRGHRDATNEELPRVDAARFVGRVAKAFHTAQERGGSLQLRLSPPELGALRLELVVQDGVLAATLETETHAARRVLLDHLPALRDRLAEQNIRIERFDVDVRQEGGGHSPSSPQQHRQQHPHHGSPHRNPSRQPAPAPESDPATPAAAGLTGDTQINLVA